MDNSTTQSSRIFENRNYIDLIVNGLVVPRNRNHVTGEELTAIVGKTYRIINRRTYKSVLAVCTQHNPITFKLID